MLCFEVILYRPIIFQTSSGQIDSFIKLAAYAFFSKHILENFRILVLIVENIVKVFI